MGRVDAKAAAGVPLEPREEHGGCKDEEKEGGGGYLERRVETHWRSPWAWGDWEDRGPSLSFGGEE